MKLKHILLKLLIISIPFAIDFSGTIYELGNNKPLSSVNISIDSLKIGTASDQRGNFTISNIPEGKHQIEISLIGYQKIYYELNYLSSDLEKKFYLQPIKLLINTIEVKEVLRSKLSAENIKTINKHLIKKNPSQSITELLSPIEGIDIQQSYNYSRNTNISIRGSSDFKPGGYNNRVLIMLDGFPINIPNSGGADWNAIPLNNIDRIEVAKGPGSALYGHNAMGGIINLVTQNRHSKKFDSYIEYGSYNHQALGLQSNISNNQMNYMITLNGKTGDGHRNNSAYKLYKLFSKLSIDKSKKYDFFITNIVSYSKNGHPGFLRNDNKGISYRQSERYSNYNQIHFTYKHNDNYYNKNAISINNFYTFYSNLDSAPDDKKNIPETIYKDLSINYRTESQFKYNNNILILSGFDTGFETSKATLIQASQPQQSFFGPFLQYYYTKNKFEMRSGIRYDLRIVNSGEQNNILFFQSLSPKFNFSYIFSSNYKLNFGINRAFRAPSLSELFLSHELYYGLVVRGNQNLKSEDLTAYEIGFDIKKEKFKLKNNVFYNQYSNMIDFIYSVPAKANNRKNVVGYGLEHSSTYTNKLFSVGLNYTFLKMDNIDDDVPSIYRPKHKWSTFFSFNLNQKFSFKLTNKYQSEQNYQDFLAEGSLGDDLVIDFPIKTLDPLFLMGLELDLLILPIFDIQFKIENVFNNDYKLIQDYPMPKRNFLINLKYRIKN